MRFTQTPNKSPVTRLLAALLAGGALAVAAGAHAGSVPARREVAWLNRLARGGDSGAQLQLGLAYREGRYGLSPDPRTALHWLQASANGGSAYAADLVANAYDRGQGVPRDRALARHWWQLAADGGNADAQARLGEAELAGRDSGQGVAWLRAAADRGDARAHRDLASLYRQSVVPAADLQRGSNPLAALGARLGSPGLTGLVAAWHTVATGSSFMYSRDALLARAGQGDPVAEFQLGERYRDGAWAVRRDPQQAQHWLQRAAAHGNPLAARALAATRHDY